MSTDPSLYLSRSPSLERYLRRATRGLYGVRRRQVRDELEEHVLERAHRLMVMGVAPAEALSCALRDLGAPERLSAEMTQVYLMPIVTRSAAVMALGLMLVFSAIGNSQAQVSGLSTRPIKPSCTTTHLQPSADLTIVSRTASVTCYTFNDSALYRGAYINLNELSRLFRQHGYTVIRHGQVITFHTPQVNAMLAPAFSVRGVPYADAGSAIEAFLGHASVEVSGYTNPQVRIGDVQIDFGTTGAPLDGFEFYQSLLGPLTNRLMSQPQQLSLKLGVNTSYGPARAVYVVQTDLPRGEVVMLLMRAEDGAAYASQAVVDAAGRARLAADQKRTSLSWVRNPAALTPYLSNGHAQALLVRLTNTDLSQPGRGILTPFQPTADAIVLSSVY